MPYGNRETFSLHMLGPVLGLCCQTYRQHSRIFSVNLQEKPSTTATRVPGTLGQACALCFLLPKANDTARLQPLPPRRDSPNAPKI